MRRAALPLTLVALLLTAPAAIAAPTCQTRTGATIRCGTPGAMPVGWIAPARDRADDGVGRLSVGEFAGLAAALATIFALLSNLPAFDGWDRQEGEEDTRR